MPATAIVFLDLPPGLPTPTCKVIDLTTGSSVETVTLTGSGEKYTGSVAGAFAGLYLFKFYSGTGMVGARLRTIANDAGPYVILTELESSSAVPSGAFVVGITVDDGTTGVSSAVVCVTGSGVSITRTSGALGVVPSIGLEAGTYAVTIVKSGFETFAGTLVVSAAASPTYSLTATTHTLPSAPGLSTGFGIVYDEFNAPEVGVPVSVQMTAGPGDSGNFLDTAIRTAVSDVTGYVEFVGLRQGATYNIWRGPGAITVSSPLLFAPSTVNTARTSFVAPYLVEFTLPEVIGADA